MSSEINICEDKRLIEVNLSGFMTMDELWTEGQKLKGLAKRLGKMKYLVNAAKAMSMTRTWPNALLEPGNWWTLSRICDEIAVVVREEDGAYLRFLEIAARNTGAKMKLFSDLDGAYKWLGVH